MDIERLLWQIAGKDNWEAIEEVDNWLVLFDFMPPRMRTALDYKIQGLSIDEIAKEMNITKKVVYEHLHKAKSRILNSIL